MTLTLRVLQAPQGVSQIEPRQLDSSLCPFAIGRGPDNDWVLEDPDKHISKVHCRIVAEGDGLYLLDTSSNGVFFATESRPVGRGKRRPLDSGDSFRIGDYRIAIARDPGVRLPEVIDGPHPAIVPGEGGLSNLLAGLTGGVETRAAHSVAGDASEWLGALPNGSVDNQIVQPLGWHAPPATSLTDVPEDMEQPLSEFVSMSEHIPAVNAALQIAGAKTVLPMDWNLGAESGASASLGASLLQNGSGAAGWHAAQEALIEGAGLGGLLPDGVSLADGRDAMVRTGQILRRLVDALAAIEAVQRTTERELGLSDETPHGEDLPTLLSAAIWTADAAATDELIQRVATSAKNLRALGLAVAETASDVGAQIQPEVVEETARGEARLAVGPLLRAASWERYCLVHANLSGIAEAPAADAVLAPLRRFFAQRA